MVGFGLFHFFQLSLRSTKVINIENLNYLPFYDSLVDTFASNGNHWVTIWNTNQINKQGEHNCYEGIIAYHIKYIVYNDTLIITFV